MKILVSHPGRFGDLIWALPSIRAIKQARPDAEITLCLPEKYGAIGSLLERQDYLAEVRVLPAWQIMETAPITPRTPPPLDARSTFSHREDDFDQVFHLGYEGWPKLALPYETQAILHQQWPEGWGPAPTIDLATPWITPTYAQASAKDLAIGFTDEHFELKYGLWWLLQIQLIHQTDDAKRHEGVWVGNSPRWEKEGQQHVWSWESAAAWIASSRVFVGCCSALHVLAVAVGTPVVCVEPNAHRHHSVFWPEGVDVRKVIGGDGLPTIDSRHLIDTIESVWKGQEAITRG